MLKIKYRYWIDNINDTKDLDKYLEYIKADFYNYVKSDNFNS